MSMDTERRTDHDLLIKIAERVEYVAERVDRFEVGCRENRTACQECFREELKKKLNRAEFVPVKLIAFGLVGVLLSGVILAIVKQALQT